MNEIQRHPIFGLVLFLLGALIITATYAVHDPDYVALIFGHVLVLNGVLYAFAGTTHRTVDPTAILADRRVEKSTRRFIAATQKPVSAQSLD
jgi:hypothetical protein